MTLRVAIQMDPIQSINIDADTTFVLGLEAQRRGYGVHHYLPRDMSLSGGKVTARTSPMTLRREHGNHFTLGPAERVDLAGFDVILLRQDPPFDMAYITSTHLLEHLHPATLVVNDPVHVRNAPEKLLITHFPELMPPTLISADRNAIRDFREEHGDIVIKPLYGFGGWGVFHVKPGDENLSALIELYTQHSNEPLVVQRYIPEIREGDKRIILVDGEPKGAVLRVPALGEARANMHVGGKPVRTGLTDREREICATIGPMLRERGMILVGIDVIGPYLTEINVTCPTGIQEIDRLNGARLESDVWDAIEKRLAASG